MRAYFTSKEKGIDRYIENDNCYVPDGTGLVEAEKFARAAIEYFNDTLRPYEKPREFVKMDRIEKE
jgi:hypothetical protein